MFSYCFYKIEYVRYIYHPLMYRNHQGFPLKEKHHLFPNEKDKPVVLGDVLLCMKQ